MNIKLYIMLSNNMVQSVKMSKSKEVSSGKEGMLTDDNIFELLDVYFNRKYIMYAHAKNSFDKFIEDDIKNFLLKIYEF